MKKIKFKKFTVGPVESGLVVVAIVVAGVIGYQFADIRDKSQDTLANADQEGQADQAAEIEAKEQENKQQEVSIPVEQKPEEAKPVEAKPAPAPAEQKPAEEQKPKPKPAKLSLSASVRQSGNTINVAVTLGESVNGKCHIKFTKKVNNQQQKVYREVSSSGNRCNTSFSASQFAADGSWDFGVWFLSNDKTREGWHGSSFSVSL